MKPRKYAQGTEAVTIPEAARILGISEHTLWNRVRDGSVQVFRIGKLVRVSRKMLERLMNGE